VAAQIANVHHPHARLVFSVTEACSDLQRATGGLTEFVPLPFVHMEAPIFRKGLSRAGPTLREALLMHAIARLVLFPWVLNIQASWVKMGPHWAGELLRVGCNDMGGSIMNESITRYASFNLAMVWTTVSVVLLMHGENDLLD
jgi:FO synthase